MMTISDQGARTRRLQLIAKRAFDIVASATTLIVLSPLFLLTALAIKLETHEPVFSTSLMFCYDGQKVRTIRFRCGGFIHSPSRMGDFLARSGLDKLPMLINVLRGDMSIVGPRYHAVLHSTPLSEQLALALKDCPLRPGLCSLEDEVGTEALVIKADLFYLANWSLLLDAKILCKCLLSKASYL